MDNVHACLHSLFTEFCMRAYIGFMTNLIELIYTSFRASQVGTSAADYSDITNILETARKHNAAAGITGMLSFDGKRFIQIIEGEADDIEALFEKIADDPRHTQVELLHTGAIETRAFSDWKMAFKQVPHELLSEDSELIDILTFFEAETTFVSGPQSFGSRMFSLFMHSG